MNAPIAPSEADKASTIARTRIPRLFTSIGRRSARMIPLALRSCETASERHAGDDLQRSRRRDPANGSEPVPLHQVPLRIVREVGDRAIRRAPEVHGVVHGRELDLVQRVEDIEPYLEFRALRDAEVLRDRQVEIVERWFAREEPWRFIALASRLRPRET